MLIIFRDTYSQNLYRREWELLSLYMFHLVILILLIVSSLILNLIAAQVDIARKNTQNAAVRKYHITKP